MNASTSLIRDRDASLIRVIIDHRMGLRQAHDTGRTPAQTSTSSRKDAARTGPRTNKTRATGKEANCGYQEECEARPDGCGESAGKGLGADEELYHQVLPDADAVAGDFFTDTGKGEHWVVCMGVVR